VQKVSDAVKDQLANKALGEVVKDENPMVSAEAGRDRFAGFYKRPHLNAQATCPLCGAGVSYPTWLLPAWFLPLATITFGTAGVLTMHPILFVVFSLAILIYLVQFLMGKQSLCKKCGLRVSPIISPPPDIPPDGMGGP